jgi:hypothetical protein
MNQNQDNQNSWGYWGASNIQDENNNARIDNSISNSIQNSNNSSNITDPAYVQNLMDNTTTTTELNFSGTITPNIDVGTISANNINFNFKFGGMNNNVNGGYEFNSFNFTSHRACTEDYYCAENYGGTWLCDAGA